jgi:hypothetical protein
MKALGICGVALAATMASTLAQPETAVAADFNRSRTAGGLTVYLGVLPAAMIQGHPKEHSEPTMHGGIPRGEHAYHVMVAVFDASDGARIDNAGVDASVTPLGLAAATHRLEPMMIAGAMTYGSYFTMRGDGPYEITISVTLVNASEPILLEFSYSHFTR